MKDTMKLAFSGILIGLMFVLSWTVLGMIPLGVASATTVFIPLAIGIVFLDDFRYSTLLGLSFGVCSLLRALVPQGFLDPYFVNPLVSVLPRLLVGIICYLIYKLLKKIIKNRILISAITGGSVALLNTIFTMTMLVVTNYNSVSQTFIDNGFSLFTALKTIALLNMIPEIIVGIIITPIIVKVLDKIKYRDIEEEQ